MVTRIFLLLCLGFGLSGGVQALEYRSISVPVTVFYDAPSAHGKKLFLVKEGMPVEVLVQVEGWTKVRDAEGSIAWVERNTLDTRRTVVVTTAVADIRKAASDDAPVVFQAAKWVTLDLVEPGPAGWVRVKHRDGSTGFVRITQVWGA